MTHCYSVCNGLALLIRYNENDDIVEYRYSDEEDIKTSPIYYDTDSGDMRPYINVNGEMFALDEFCKINM